MGAETTAQSRPTKKGESEEVRQHLARARERTREMGAQIEAFSLRVAAMRGLCDRVGGLSDQAASLHPPMPRPTAQEQWLQDRVDRQSEELDLAHEELRTQNDELREAYGLVEQQRERYLDLFENAPDAYLATDARGVIAEANEVAAKMLGVVREVLPGKLLVSFVARRDTNPFRERLNALAMGDGHARLSFNMRARGGAPFPAELTVRRVLVRHGSAIELRWTIRQARQEMCDAEADLLAGVATALRRTLDIGGEAAALVVEDVEQLARASRAEPRALLSPAQLVHRAAEHARQHTPQGAVSMDVASLEDGVSLRVGVDRATWALARLLTIFGTARLRGWRVASQYVIEMRMVGAPQLGDSPLARAAVHAVLGAEGGGLRITHAREGGDEALVCEINLPVDGGEPTSEATQATQADSG